jgi:hypothetical protein
VVIIKGRTKTSSEDGELNEGSEKESDYQDLKTSKIESISDLEIRDDA